MSTDVRDQIMESLETFKRLFDLMLNPMKFQEDSSLIIKENDIKNEYQKSIFNIGCVGKLNLISDLLKSFHSENDKKEIAKKIAKKIVLILEMYPRGSLHRIEYIDRIGFSLTDRKCLKEMAKFLGDSNVVEIGAGSGYLSFLLKHYAGVNITATDKITNPNDWLQFQECKKFDSTKDNLSDMFPDCNAILVSWPKLYLKSVMDNLPLTVTKIIVIGEGVEECTDCLYNVTDIESDEDEDEDGNETGGDEDDKDDKEIGDDGDDKETGGDNKGVKVYEFNKFSDDSDNDDDDNNKTYPFQEVEHDVELPRFSGLLDVMKFYERY